MWGLLIVQDDNGSAGPDLEPLRLSKGNDAFQ